MAIVVALALLLVWQVHLHNAESPNAHELTTVSVTGSEKITQGMLNRVEAVIRAYDPCLSCSTHAVGGMALRIQLVGPDIEWVTMIAGPI